MTSVGGIVYLVGAGPGDPGLITVRGRELLESADIVVYDALANPTFLEMARAANASVELHDVGKRGGDADSTPQSEINALLVTLARSGSGKRVVRLKGGDPLVFGRGSEEAEALAKAGVRFEIVPGVTAGIAAPAYAGIPVTHRGVATSVTFVTGHEDPTKESTTTDWAALARAGGTIVLYMGVAKLPAIANALMAGGRPGSTPAAAIQWGTHPRQRTVVATLATLVDRVREEALSAPVITVIGESVRLRDSIAWFETRPLFGKRIVVTRARAQAGTMSARLRELGAEVIEMPAIEIRAIESDVATGAISRLSEYDWAVFTSQNAVELFWKLLRDQHMDARALQGLRVAAVGPSTAGALLARGIAVDATPERFVAEGLLETLKARRDVANRKVLYLSAVDSRDVLERGFEEIGATVDVVPLYRSVIDGAGAQALRERLSRGDVDLVTFTSASAVLAYVEAVGDVAGKTRAASIGPVTTTAARSAGLDVTIEASASTIDGLIDAIVAEFR